MFADFEIEIMEKHLDDETLTLQERENPLEFTASHVLFSGSAYVSDGNQVPETEQQSNQRSQIPTC
ncbi:hypothetical protein WAI453_010966 [Rhynchosporium graminicola]